MPVLSRRLGWVTLVGWLGLVGLSGANPQAHAPAPGFSEYQVKAVFLFNFAQFVEWPAGAFASTNAPLVIGVLGQNPFGQALDQAVAGERVDGRPLVVRYSQDLADLRQVHLLFIASSEQPRLERILAQVQGTGVLTVGEGLGFIQAGGIIAFLMEDNRVRFAIDPAAAHREGMRISTKLLKVARIARDPQRQER